MLDLFNKFPREIGTPKRVVVYSMEEMLDKVNKLNGKVKVFVDIYNFTSNPKVDEQALDVDKIFFDLDSDEGIEKIKKMHKWASENDYKHIMFFSGKGFHFYLLATGYQNLKNKTDTVYNAQHFIAEEIGLTIGEKRTHDIDQKTVGRISQMATFPGTWNCSRERYCIGVTEEDLERGYDYIREKAKKQNLDFKYYGSKLFDISKFDTERPKEFPLLEISKDLKIKIDGDKFLRSIPPCIAHWLDMEHIGYDRRGYLICYLRDTGYLLEETIQILDKYMKDRAEFIHCTTSNVAPGYHVRGEKQPQYLYGRGRNRTGFPSCEKIKALGDCPFSGSKRCDKWKIYK